MAPGDPPAAGAKPRPVISSCMVGGVSTVYLVDKTNWLKSYANDLPAAQLDTEVVASSKVQRRDYQTKSIDFVGKTDGIQSKTRDIAALSFLLADPKDTIRSRLYYIDSDGVLAELRQDNPKNTPLTSIVGWTPGISLKNKGYKVVEHSPITAHMSPATNTIKVYYYPKEFPTAQWVAWWVGNGSETWETQPLIAPQD